MTLELSWRVDPWGHTAQIDDTLTGHEMLVRPRGMPHRGGTLAF